VDTLTTVLHSYGHKASEWPQIYQQDPDFATTYQLLGTGVNATNFHIQDKSLCHIYIPTSKHAKMIWEAHYSCMVGQFGVDKTMAILQKKNIGQNFGRMSASIYYIAFPVPFPSQPSRSKAYKTIFLLLRILGNPSQWITCLAFHPPSKEIIVYLWSLIDF
jgi:hypothetical protein